MLKTKTVLLFEWYFLHRHCVPDHSEGLFLQLQQLLSEKSDTAKSVTKTIWGFPGERSVALRWDFCIRNDGSAQAASQVRAPTADKKERLKLLQLEPAAGGSGAVGPDTHSNC